MNETPHGAGKSSFDLLDSKALLTKLEPLQGKTVLDLGCGYGDYSLALAERVGPAGLIQAVDAWEEGITDLRRRARDVEGAPVRTHIADAGLGLPLEENSVDVCLMAAVLHDIIQGDGHHVALSEVARVLRPEGTLAIVEFRKMEGPPGPPRHIRLSEDELRGVLEPRGFFVQGAQLLGEHFYLAKCGLATAG